MQIYEFHISKIIIHHLDGLFGPNILTSSQLASSIYFFVHSSLSHSFTLIVIYLVVRYIAYSSTLCLKFHQCNNPLTKEPKLQGAVRIVKEWPDLDNEVRRLQERVAAQKPSSKDSQESTEPTGRVNAFSRTDASSAVAVWPLALAKGATLRFRKGGFPNSRVSCSQSFSYPTTPYDNSFSEEKSFVSQVVISDEVRDVSTAYSESSSADFSIGT